MILCAGEALIDMLPRETAAGEAAFAPFAGGAVFNTAIALGRLQVPTSFFCPISDDLFGQRLRRALTESGVDHSLSPAVDRPCTLAFVSLHKGQARYAFYDTGTALRAMQPHELPPLPKAANTLFLGGISLVTNPCADVFAELCQRAGDRVVMLDPNIRPGFIRDESSYRARLTRMIARADIVKLSDEDLHWLMGAGEIDTVAQALRDQGPSIVVITEGAKGARALHAGGVSVVAAQPVTVRDTVGAGDTFNAGFLAALASAKALRKGVLAAPDPALIEQALRIGARAAAVAVSRAGANPPWADEI